MPTQEASINDFGLLIAFVLPGFTALIGASYFSPEIRSWIGSSDAVAPTLGGFLYMTVASIAAGLTVSTIRWLLIDSLHHATGLRRPQWNFAHLPNKVDAYSILTDFHYKFYQFYANELISLAWVALTRRWVRGFSLPPDRVDVGLLVLMVVFFLGSRDTLRKFYSRTGQLLQARQPDERDKATGSLTA